MKIISPFFYSNEYKLNNKQTYEGWIEISANSMNNVQLNKFNFFSL